MAVTVVLVDVAVPVVLVDVVVKVLRVWHTRLLMFPTQD